MEPKLFIATKAIINNNGKVLILREAGSYVEGTNMGCYVLPGGRLKAGEYFKDALRREVLEETGLEIKIGNPITVNEWRPVVKNEQWQVVAVFFECQSTSSEVALSEDHDVYEWINPEEYKKYKIINDLKPVFEEYLKKRKEI